MTDAGKILRRGPVVHGVFAENRPRLDLLGVLVRRLAHTSLLNGLLKSGIRPVFGGFRNGLVEHHKEKRDLDIRVLGKAFKKVGWRNIGHVVAQE